MKAGKIALWTFGALLLSGTLFGFGLMEDARRNNGGFDFHLGDFGNFGPGESITIDQTEKTDAKQFKRIEIRTDSPDLTVTPQPGTEVSARLSGTVRTTAPKSVPSLVREEKGDTLIFRLQREQTGVIGSFSSNLQLDVFLPEAWHGELILSGSSSDVSLPGGTFSHLAVTTDSGDLTLGTLATEGRFELETASGEISLESADCGQATLKTLSGDKDIGVMTVKGALQMNSASGYTKLGSVTAGNCSINSQSGDIRIEMMTADGIRLSGASAVLTGNSLSGRVDAETASGDVTLSFEKPGDHITVMTSSGSVRIRVPAETGLDVEAGSTSGSVGGSLKLEGGTKKEHVWTGTSGDKAVRVNISTASGNITLD